MHARRIGPFTVSALSLGCMNLSHAYGAPPPPDVAEALLRRALNLGAAELKLDAALLQRLDALMHRHSVHGARYSPATQAEIDTEEFAD